MNRNLMFGGHQSSAFTDLLMKEKCLEFTRNYHRAKTSLEVLAQQQQQQTAQQNRLGVGAGQTWRSPLELLKVEDNIAIQQTPEAVDKTPQGTPEPPRWDNLFRLFNPSLRKLSSPGQTPICPLCGITLTPQQMSEHLELEMEKFAEFYSCRRWLAPTERTQEDDLVSYRCLSVVVNNAFVMITQGNTRAVYAINFCTLKFRDFSFRPRLEGLLRLCSFFSQCTIELTTCYLLMAVELRVRLSRINQLVESYATAILGEQY